MQFTFDEDQLLFQSTVREFLAKECTPDVVRSAWAAETGRAPGLWAKLAELGVPGLLVPEAQHGMGMDEIDAVLLYEEAGRAALAEPLVATGAVAAPMIAALADLPEGEAWLERIARGDAVVAVGHEVSPFVEDADVADLLLVQRGDAVHAVDPGRAQVVREPANDPARRLFSVSFEATRETCVADGGVGRDLWAAALDRGAFACAAQQIGATDHLVEMAVAYAGQREQFGVPIGSFQAVKHMLADVKVALEYARPVVYRAAHAVARGLAERSVHVSMAKLVASQAALRGARVALQVHGAIGYTWEQDLHIWMRRAWSLEMAWGRSAFHRKRVGQAILAPDAWLGPGETFAAAEGEP